MSEAITTLRDGLKAGLIAARTDAGTRVESERSDFVYAHPQDAAGNLPKLCVYVLEDTSVANANGTVWECRASIAVESWAYGLSDATAQKTAEEVAADRRDKLDGQAVRAIVNDQALLSRLGIARVTKARTVRQTGTQGELVYSASKTYLDVDLFDREELCEGADLLERVDIDAAVDPAGADPDMTVTAQVPQEDSP